MVDMFRAFGIDGTFEWKVIQFSDLTRPRKYIYIFLAAKFKN
jgi:hypothetical protein